MANSHPALNTIKELDKFRVVAYNTALKAHYLFQVCGDRGTRRASFTCHIYDTPGLRSPAHIRTATMGRDSFGEIRSHGEGATLEELIFNLDWAHLPSELAQLKALLSTRVTTDAGEVVGDLVLRRLTAEQAQRADEEMTRRAQEHAKAIREQAAVLAEQTINMASEQQLAAARFGLRQGLKFEFYSVPS